MLGAEDEEVNMTQVGYRKYRNKYNRRQIVIGTNNSSTESALKISE